MPKSIYSQVYKEVVWVLAEARRQAGMTQADLAEAIGRDQSFISLVETARRRLDIVEFCALARALQRDPLEPVTEVVRRLPLDLVV